ncbi:Peptidylprolyl isomerase [Candidatus Bealeia paramacronuclearis]|uniref:Peptidylprolyl isomerase n=1 Tax=Candidatus Bealeia paramacronuclearis TaxID=1921001 RepID=A0ABZ2C3H1_9PROT|nr:Peptidylprolyl isomerase [Candidatus Bealeia paramacronuclearis]
MIQAFHNFSQSWIAKGFLIIVALSFGAFFGQSDFFRKHDPNAIVAEVGGHAIGRETLQMEIQKKLREIQAQSGQTIDPAQIQALNLPRMVLENMIQSSLLAQEVERLKLMVRDEDVVSALQKIPAFQDDKGNFSRKNFEIVLQNNGFTEQMFVDQMRDDLLREQLIEAIKSGVTVPAIMANHLFNAEYQSRQAAMVTFKPETMPAPNVPAETDLQTYYNEHKDQFVAPEMRSFTVLLINANDIAKEIIPGEDDIQAEYRAKIAHYENKPLAEVKDKVIHDLQMHQAVDKIYELTQSLDDTLAGGATLEEVAKAHKLSTMKVEAVDGQGTTLQGDASPAFKGVDFLKDVVLATAFSTEDGQDSNFIDGPQGIHFLVRVDDVKPSQAQTFAEAKLRVEKAWTLEQQIQEAVTRAKTLAQDINTGIKKPTMLELLPNLILAEGKSTLPEQVQEAIMTLALGKAGVVPVKDGVAVVVLNQIIEPSETVKTEKFDGFKKDIEKRLASDVVNDFVDALRVQFPVRINSAALKMLTQSNEG